MTLTEMFTICDSCIYMRHVFVGMTLRTAWRM